MRATAPLLRLRPSPVPELGSRCPAATSGMNYGVRFAFDRGLRPNCESHMKPDLLFFQAKPPDPLCPGPWLQGWGPAVQALGT